MLVSKTWHKIEDEAMSEPTVPGLDPVDAGGDLRKLGIAEAAYNFKMKTITTRLNQATIAVNSAPDSAKTRPRV
jgi:hypothetical protein